MTQSLHKRRWLKWVTSLLIIILLIVSFLPYGVRYGIEYWYQKQGVERVTLQDVNLNVFTGKLQLSNLEVQSDAQTLLKLDSLIIGFDWMPLFRKRLFIPALQINKLDVIVRQNTANVINIAGISIPTTNTSDSPAEAPGSWGVAMHNIEINQSTITAITPQQTLSFDIDHIKLDKLASWSAQSSQIYFTGKINNAWLDLSGKFELFSRQPAFKGDINLKGFDLTAIRPYIGDTVKDLKGKLNLKTKLEIQYNAEKKHGAQLALSADSDIHMHNFSLSFKDQIISQDMLTWKGNSKFTLTPNHNTYDYHLDGQLGSENFNLTSGNTVRYHHANLNWTGDANISDKKPLSAQGKLNGKNLQLEYLPSQQQLFTARKLAIENIGIQGLQQISTGTIRFNNLLALNVRANGKKQNPALLQAALLEVESTSLQQLKQVQTGNIRLNDALLHLHLNQQGRLQQLALLADAKKKSPDISSQKKSGADQTEMTFSVSQFEVTGKSHIQIVDESVKPVFKSGLLPSEITIGTLDSNKQETASPFSIKAKLDEYSSIAIKGDIYPFVKPLTLNLTADIKNINLPIVSSYTAKTLGHNIESGQLNANLSLDIKKGNINALAKLLISNLGVKPADAKKAGELTAQISMPLESALSLLRNKNNDIKLEIPVSGNINKPDFNIGGIINTAIGNALKKTTMTYLTLALQPYGALIALANLADAATNAVTLNPVYFNAATASLTEDAKAYADKIATVLNDRPQLRIKLCGKAVSADRKKIISEKILNGRKKRDASKDDKPAFTVNDEELIKIANNRANNFKLHLVRQHDIKPSRLFLCQPAIDNKLQAKPRIDINI